MCHCTEYKISALLFRISEENLLNAITQQFITAKISGCVLGGFLTPTPLCVRPWVNLFTVTGHMDRGISLAGRKNSLILS